MVAMILYLWSFAISMGNGMAKVLYFLSIVSMDIQVLGSVLCNMQFHAKIILLTFHCVSFSHKNVGSDWPNVPYSVWCIVLRAGWVATSFPKKEKEKGCRTEKDTDFIGRIGILST